MKKIILLIVFLSFIFGLAACTREIDTELDPPQNVTLTGDVVSWDAVSDADSYIVFIDTKEVEVQTTSYDLSLQNLADGSYSITVVAVKDDALSLPSTVLTYVVGDEDETIDAPANLAITDGLLTWNAVTDATGYVVHVGAMTFNASGTSMDLLLESIPEGTHSVYVVAVKDALESDHSISINYTVESNVSQELVILAVLQTIDSRYVADMDETDFEEPWDYYDYLAAADAANAYAEATIELGMTQTAALSFIGDAADIALDMPNMTSMNDMMLSLEIFEDYDMDASDLAVMVYKLLDVMMNANLRSLEQNITRYEQEILDLETQITDIKANQDLDDLYSFMETYASADEYDGLDALFTGEYDQLYYVIYDIREMLLFDGSIVEPYDYGDEMMADYVTDLIVIFTNMITDPTGEAFLMNIFQEISILQDLTDAVTGKSYTEYDIEDMTNEIQMIEDAQAAIILNEAEMIGSLEVVFDFVLTFKNSVPQNVIDLLDDAMLGDVLTMTEMMLIKDEMVLVLQAALPEVEDFELVYETLITIAGSTTDMDVTSYLAYASLVAQAEHASIDLFLTLLGDIDEALITGGMTILDDALDEFGEYDLENNPEVAIDFALYVINYIETFVEENQTKVDALTALYSDQIKEEVYLMLLDAIKVQIENDTYMEENERLILLDFIDEMALEFDTYNDLVNLLGDTTKDVLRYIIDSEARIFTTLMTLSEVAEPDFSLILGDLELLIEDIHMIDLAIFDGMTATEIDLIFDAAYLPVKTMFEVNEPLIPFDTLYTALNPHIKTLILNVIDLQTDLMTQADLLDLDAIILNPNLSSEQLGISIAVITALDATLTVENEALIFTSLDLVFDSILGNTTLMMLTNMTGSQIDQMQLDAINDITMIIDEIQELALLDFDDLSLEDEDRIMLFMSDLGLFPEQQQMR
jgi:hypothetical protein